MAYFYDTNILLQTDLSKLETPFYLSSVTLQELEHIKTSSNKSDEIKFKARKATRWLQNNESKYTCVPRTNATDYYCSLCNVDSSVPDNQIMSCAKFYNEQITPIIFVTNDIACYNIAKHVFNLEVKSLKIESNDYRGYCYKLLTSNDFNNIYNEYNNGNNPYDLIENQYLIIKNVETQEETEYVYRFGKLERLKLPKTIKALNSKQRCALDLLNNPDIPIKVIGGVYGSGKTLLAIRSALYQTQEKGNYSSVLLVRNPTGSGEEVGFLPGDLEEKTADFFAPFIDNMKGGEQELESLKMQGIIDTQIPFYLKGRSIPNTFIVVDEAEDLTAKDFKLIGSRIAKESCVVFTGDFKQAETKYVHNNGLSKFIQYISQNPDPLVGVVILDDDVRSSASKYFVNFD